MPFSSLTVLIASIFTVTTALAEQPDAVANPPAADQRAKDAAPPSALPPPPVNASQAAVNDALQKSIEPSKDCYRGIHTEFDNDMIGGALNSLARKVGEPGGLCDRYRDYAADFPLEVGVPVFPGVSVNLDKLCKLIQRPPCPEPAAAPPDPSGEAKK